MREIYAGLDIETTGTNVFKHGVCQLGISTEDGFEFVMDCNPLPCEIEDEAMAVNKFTLPRIENAPLVGVVDVALQSALRDWYGTEPVRIIGVGWNVGSFDLPFIHKAFPLSSKFLSYRSVDLNALLFSLDRARKGVKGVMRFDGLKKHSKLHAAAVLAAKGVPEQWHDALYDAKAGYYAWQWLWAKLVGVMD